MAKKKFINQLYRKNKSSMVTSKMLQEQSVNAILADSENRTLWINGSPYGNAYVKPDTNNNYDRLDPSNKDYGPIHAEIFNDFDNNTAEGDYSHAEGKGTQTYNEGEHAEGKYNYSIKSEDIEIDELDTDAKKSKGTISTIGIGTNEENRKNAFRVDNSGEVYIVGVESTLPDGRKVSYDPCNYDGAKKTVETRSLQEVIQGLGTMQEVTYGELRTLIDNKRLVPGMQYRITDYASNTDTITETYKDTYKFAANQFDIIVVADSENTLNKNARACKHDFENDIKYIAENIINSDPYINDENSEDDNFSYISYENYLVYKTLTDIEKRNYSNKSQEIYNKVIEATKEIESKKSYFNNTDIESWKLQYNYNNENSWQNTNSENQKILVNVEVTTGNYQLREYIYESEIEDTVINNINYKYKWRLFRYQDSNKNSYDFDTTEQIINVNMYKTEDGTEIYNTYYDNILLTQLLYPSKENPGELFFGSDNQLYRINNNNDTITETIKSYLINDIVLLNIEYSNETRNFLYSGETYYNGEKVYKWYEIDYINNENNIIGLENLNENTFNTSNCNIKIKEDTNGQYKTFILSKSLTPLKESENNNQKYITGADKNENELSFIKDTYFKEYLKEPDKITKYSDYKVGYCSKSPNSSLYDLINVFQKNNSTDIDFNIHYNLTDEIYEYNNNGTYEYYSVWCISDSMYGSTDVKILVGDINTTDYSPYKNQSQVVDFINSLKSKTYSENLEYGNDLIDKLTDALRKKKFYSYNINEGIKFYDINENYSINTLVFNSIIFNYDNDSISNISVNRVLDNQQGLIYNFSWLENTNLSIPENNEKFILFKKFYNHYKENFIEDTELKLYFSENNLNNNFNIYSDLYNNVYIYYTYSPNAILSYNNFKFINKYYKSQGIINYLCDEFNNECYYDFKNIKFKIDLPWYKSNSDLYTVNIKIDGDQIKIIDSANNTEQLEPIENLRNSSAKVNENNEIYDFYYFYTFSSLVAGNILDSSLNNNTNNNSILNINLDILVKNIFIDCEVNNNKIINSENIILYKSKFCNNIINNCTYEYSDFNIFNMLIYYGKATGGSDGSFDIPWGRDALGKVNFENNIINNSSNIQFLPNNTSENLGNLTPYNISNNKLYDYNNLQFINTLNSAVLFDYTEPSIKKISDKENTVIDVPNIKTYKNNGDNILNISHDNININSFTKDTNITSSNKSKILANKYVFLQGNENINNTDVETTSINLDYTIESNNGDFYFDSTEILDSSIDKLSNTSFNSNRDKLNFRYSFKRNANEGGLRYIGVGPNLAKVKNNDGEYEYWDDNKNNTYQYSLYCLGTNLVKPNGFPKKLSYDKTIFASFEVINPNKNPEPKDILDNQYLAKYLSTTITSIQLKNDYNINNLINIFPSFWFPIMGYMENDKYDVRFVFNCKYYLTYDIEYTSDYKGCGNQVGEFNILNKIVSNFDNSTYYITPNTDDKYFCILCLNSLKIISESQKEVLKGNIENVIKQINDKIEVCIGNNYNDYEERYVKTLKLGVKVTFEDIGGATVLSKSRCSFFRIPYLKVIDSYFVNSTPLVKNITTKRSNETEVYKCMWNIPWKDNNNSIEYNDQMQDSVSHIFTNLPNNEQSDYWYLYDKLEEVSNKDIIFDKVILEKEVGNDVTINKEKEAININSIFTVSQQYKYQKIPKTSKAEYNENNGVYVQLHNDATVLSVRQIFDSGLKYINLGFDKSGYQIISFNIDDNNNKDIKLIELYNLLNP